MLIWNYLVDGVAPNVDKKKVLIKISVKMSGPYFDMMFCYFFIWFSPGLGQRNPIKMSLALILFLLNPKGTQELLPLMWAL